MGQGIKMSARYLRFFLFLLVFVAATPLSAFAYNYEDYLPPEERAAENIVVASPSSSQPSYNRPGKDRPGNDRPGDAAGGASVSAPGPSVAAAAASASNNRSLSGSNEAASGAGTSYAGDSGNDKAAEENHRQAGDWYVALGAGATQRPAALAGGEGSFGPGTAKIDFQAGPTATLAVGYRVLPYFRVEGELDYSDYDVKDVRPNVPGFPPVNGNTFKSVSSTNPIYRGAFMLNGYFDLPGYGPLVPYAGGGLGVARLFGTTNISQDSAGLQLFTNFNRFTAGVAMLEAGVDVIISDHWSVAPSYRYLHYFAYNDDNVGDETAQIFKMNARFSF